MTLQQVSKIKVLILAGLIGLSSLPDQAIGQEVHALSLRGAVKYSADANHFDYANPDAPKGGDVRLSAIGTFDSFNSYSFKGVTAAGLDLIYDTLAVNSRDETFTIYGHLAEAMWLAEDGRAITFRLRPGINWHDGEPLTAADVVWSYTTAIEVNEQIKSYLADIDTITAVSELEIKFSFKTDQNPELPLIIGPSVPILPRHIWEKVDMSKPNVKVIPVGSGAYRIADFQTGRYLVYERVADYWGDQTLTGKGHNNFASIRYDYFRDHDIIREAARGGKIDFHIENTAKEWAVGYDIESVKSGRINLYEIPLTTPKGMQGFIMNLRRPQFSDPVLREAIAYAMDFGWMNKFLFYEQYQRNRSFFGAPNMSADQLPDPKELAILAPLRGQIPDRVFTTVYQPPQSDGSTETNRANLRAALNLLQQNGYQLRQGKLYPPDSEQPVEFEILLYSPAFKRISLPFAQNLERLGITASVELIDVAQYIKRLKTFDYDMIVGGWGQSDSPGNEQYNYWSSQAAKASNSQNYSGIANPAIDKIISQLVAAESEADLHAAVRALDRTLLFSFIVVPHWYAGILRIVANSDLQFPQQTNKHGTQLDLWWKQ